VKKRWMVGALTAVLVLSACGDDDGGDVRGSGGASASGSGSGSASGSGDAGSGSGSGLSSSDVAGSTDNELVNEAVTQYKDYLAQQVDQLVADTKTFTDAVRAGDVAAAQAAYAQSRVAWERIEPIAGLIEDIDTAVDARVDDFEGPDDPDWTGWHKLEYLLWQQNTTNGGAELADKLDADVASLQEQLPDLDLPPAALSVGAADLIEEVSEGKITGEEDRYSHTDLSDFAANIEGSKELITLLGPAIEAEDPDLLAAINEGFSEIETQLQAYEDGKGGYVSYEQLTQADKDAMQATLAELSENVSQVTGTLGLS
jgi:iron uptake system component EfeO